MTDFPSYIHRKFIQYNMAYQLHCSSAILELSKKILY